MIDAALAPILSALSDAVMYGGSVALKSSGSHGQTGVFDHEGKYLCADKGGPENSGDLFKLTGRNYVDVNESWTIDRGKDE